MQQVVRHVSALDTIKSNYTWAHPCILRMYKAWQYQGSAYILTDHLNGGAMDTRMYVQPFVEPTLFATCVLEGLVGLHDNGILWRDPRPTNVFCGNLWKSTEYYVVAGFTEALSTSVDPRTPAPKVLAQCYPLSQMQVWDSCLFAHLCILSSYRQPYSGFAVLMVV